jgi:hypothetical protein
MRLGCPLVQRTWLFSTRGRLFLTGAFVAALRQDGGGWWGGGEGLSVTTGPFLPQPSHHPHHCFPAPAPASATVPSPSQWGGGAWDAFPWPHAACGPAARAGGGGVCCRACAPIMCQSRSLPLHIRPPWPDRYPGVPGGFEPRRQVPVSIQPFVAALAAVQGDGRLDFLLAGSADVAWLNNLCGGAWRRSRGTRACAKGLRCWGGGGAGRECECHGPVCASCCCAALH